MISGRCASLASTTAGSRFATAVPEVTVMATGPPGVSALARAAPTAKNPPERSSIWDQAVIRGSATSASINGVFREPGQVTAVRMPHRANSSTRARRSR